MRRSVWHRVQTWCGVIVLLTGWGQAQYVITINGQRFDTMWSANADDVSSRMMQRNIINSLGTAGSAPASSPAPTIPTYRYPLSRMDFAFKGKPTGQKNCAAISDTAEGKKVLSDLCLQTFAAIQKRPDLRANNLALGLALVIGLSLQGARTTELSEDRAERLLRGANDAPTSALAKALAGSVKGFGFQL